MTTLREIKYATVRTGLERIILDIADTGKFVGLTAIKEIISERSGYSIPISILSNQAKALKRKR